MHDNKEAQQHWRSVVRLTQGLLLLWFIVSFVGPWFARDLEAVVIGNFPLAFWMASQGGLILFIGVVVIYAWAADRLDESYRRSAADSGAQQPDSAADG